jgi:DUF4097 and DUF4098 domain-containing protein YvlB
MHFRTASGDLALDGIAGDLQVEAVSGDVRVEARGALDVKAKSISGDFRLRGPRLGRFEMATTSGDVHIDAELSGKGPFSIKSISGDVTIVSRAGLRVEAQTVTGDIHSGVAHRIESSPGRKLVVIGKPGATLAFKSVSGDLEVVEPRDAAAGDEVFPETQGRAAPTMPSASAARDEDPADDRSAAERLDILKALERGEIDVETATARLAALEEG